MIENLQTSPPKAFSVVTTLSATLVVQSTMKLNRLNMVKNIGLAGLPIIHTRIPINPLKLVRVGWEPSRRLREDSVLMGDVSLRLL